MYSRAFDTHLVTYKDYGSEGRRRVRRTVGEIPPTDLGTRPRVETRAREGTNASSSSIGRSVVCPSCRASCVVSSSSRATNAHTTPIVIMRVHFKRANGAKVTLDDVDAAAHTVRETRARVVSAMATDGGVDSEASTTVRLIFKGRVMKDDATLDAYGVTEESVVHVVVSSAMKTTSSSSMGGGGASTAATNPGMNPANTSPSPAAAGFGGFGGAAGFSGFGDAAGFGGAAQTPPNPEAMRAMLSNPFVRSQLDALLNESPETLRELVESQPGLREAMDANPQLRSALSDPATLRQMFNAATNPSLMAEQMRSNDRAMSNISSMPGGFDALRRMYTDVQQPMERA